MAVKGSLSVHAHSCVTATCRTRYEDVCKTPTVDHKCAFCTYGAQFDLLVNHRTPKDCCILHSRVLEKEEYKQYKIGALKGWWVCRVCARTQGYDPKMFGKTVGLKDRIRGESNGSAV